MATIHVSDQHGGQIQGAEIVIEQLSKDFPFGSAIADTILGNLPYQVRQIICSTLSLNYLFLEVMVIYIFFPSNSPVSIALN